MKHAWVMWVASAVVIGVAVYLTKDADCLWGLALPAIVSVQTSKASDED